jgi:ADP-ribose pyrophosphatase YjhB (NUDIX family)
METTLIDKLAWIYLKDKKILVTRSKGKDVWYIPGGKREQGESEQQALMREIREELSVDLLPETLQYVGTFKAQAHGKPEGVFVQMTCYSGDFIGELQPATEIEEMTYLISSVDKNLLSPVDIIIFAWLKKRGLID